MRILAILSLLAIAGCITRTVEIGAVHLDVPDAATASQLRSLDISLTMYAGDIDIDQGKRISAEGLKAAVSGAPNINSPNSTSKSGDIVPPDPKPGETVLNIPPKGTAPGKQGTAPVKQGSDNPAGKPSTAGRSSTREVPATPGGG